MPHWPTPFAHAPGSVVPARGGRGAVATTDHLATAVGLEVLREGGTAVDATVAVAFALAVVNPEAGNLGGGGFLLVRTPDGSVTAQDHRSMAPQAATPDLYRSRERRAAGASVLGHLAVAVPGSVRGLDDAHRRFGRLPWPRLVEPAIGLAEGFEVRPRYLSSLPPHIVEGLGRFPQTAAIFLPRGAAPRLGSTLRQRDLADTLRRIRDHRAEGFYAGATADGIVAEMERGGGLITRDDLAAYRAVWRSPLRFAHGDHTVWSMPPSSSGGVTLALAARMVAAVRTGAGSPAPDWHGADHIHLLVEAWRRAFADRNHWLGDPDAVALPLDRLMEPAYAARRARTIDPAHASPSAEVGPGHAPPAEGDHTTHVSIVDAGGMAASFTTTLNTWYGSKLVAAGTGVLLNNEMDDFSAGSGVPNFFGLVQGEANAVGPARRPLSAMTPSLVTDPAGALRLVVGSPGGATIITTVHQVIANLLDHRMSLADAVAAPRLHHQHRPDHIQVEPGGIEAPVAAALRERGHTVREADEAWGDVEAVLVRADDSLEAVADPRRGGVAGAL